jgi:hypothetical protein
LSGGSGQVVGTSDKILLVRGPDLVFKVPTTSPRSPADGRNPQISRLEGFPLRLNQRNRRTVPISAASLTAAVLPSGIP